MTVNDLIKQLQEMSDEDRERVVVIDGFDECGDDDYRLLDDTSTGWYRIGQWGAPEFQWKVVFELGTGKKRDMDGLYQRALLLSGEG